jgi:hypothetical protein
MLNGVRNKTDSHYQALKMFMWMLHGVLNKTASHCQVLKKIIRMLHAASLCLKFW